MGQQCCHVCRRGGNHEGDEASTTCNLQLIEHNTCKIDHSDLEFIKVSGVDYLGTLWKGKWKGTVEVEIKTTKLKGNTPDYLNEVGLLSGLRHPNLMCHVGVCLEGPNLHIVTERPFNTSLLQHMLLRNRRMGLPFHVHILAQVASGMAYLEEHGLAYYDLSVRSVVVVGLECKLEVAGRVRRLSQEVEIDDLGMRLPCVPPEMLSGEKLSAKVCTWLFGMFMLEVLMGGPQEIHEYKNDVKFMRQVKKPQDFPLPDNCPSYLSSLMKQCWLMPPKRRPTFAFLGDSLQQAAAEYTEEDVRSCLQD